MDSQQRTSTPMTRAERETQTAAERLSEMVNEALASVAVPSNDADELEFRAERIERAARDLAGALKEMADEKRRRNSGHLR
jgi:predicted ATP-grasp superfamily ATP-dependent carboligase